MNFISALSHLDVEVVIPAEAETHCPNLDSRLRGNDGALLGTSDGTLFLTSDRTLTVLLTLFLNFGAPKRAGIQFT